MIRATNPDLHMVPITAGKQRRRVLRKNRLTIFRSAREFNSGSLGCEPSALSLHHGAPLPTHKKRPGKEKLLSKRTLNIIVRQVDCNPTLTTIEVKQQNLQLLGGVAVRTLQDYFHKTLK